MEGFWSRKDNGGFLAIVTSVRYAKGMVATPEAGGPVSGKVFPDPVTSNGRLP